MKCVVWYTDERIYHTSVLFYHYHTSITVKYQCIILEQRYLSISYTGTFMGYWECLSICNIQHILIDIYTELLRCRDYSVYGLSQWETTLHRNVVSHWLSPYTILCMDSANERRRYIVTSSPIGWTHTHNAPCFVVFCCGWYQSIVHCRSTGDPAPKNLD